MVEKICIICMEKCNDKHCKCQAYFHKECYEEWMKSNFNMNKGVCPHCKEELVIKDKKDCCECNCLYHIIICYKLIYDKIIGGFKKTIDILGKICMPWLPMTENYNCLELNIVIVFRMTIAVALIFILTFIIPILIGSLIIVLYYSLTDKDTKELDFKKQSGIFLLIGYGYIIFSSCCICVIKNRENRSIRNAGP